MTCFLLGMVCNKEMPYLHCSSTLLCAIKGVQVKQDGLKLNGAQQLLVCADDVNVLGGIEYIL